MISLLLVPLDISLLSLYFLLQKQYTIRNIAYKEAIASSISIAQSTSRLIANALDAHGSLFIRGRGPRTSSAGRLAKPPVVTFGTDIAFSHARFGCRGADGTGLAARGEAIAAEVALRAFIGLGGSYRRIIRRLLRSYRSLCRSCCRRIGV